MKLFPNPITSPSRLDKFQSPLKRSLRKNGGGSRSRGRSRLSPMFIRKKNEVAATETQEPSSPKVTCFGQVRVRKSKGSSRHTKQRCCCCCSIRKTLFCGRFDGKSKPSRSFRSVWERWFLFMKVGFRSKRRESIQTIQEVTEEEEDEEENTEEEDEEEAAGGRKDEVVVISSSPPKNALLLMRSKSESYRPSSLANLFWGSPVSVKDSEEIRIPEIITEQRSDEEEEDEKPTSEKELTCRDSTSESRKNGSKIEEKLGLCEEIENNSSSSSRSSTTTNIRSSKIEDERGRNPVPALPPIVLRRSKSEPASRISVEA